MDIINSKDVSKDIFVELNFWSSIKNLGFECFQGELLFGKYHWSDEGLPVLEIILGLVFKGEEEFRVVFEVETEKDGRWGVILLELIVVALVFLFDKIFVDLNFGGEDDSFLFVERLLVVDVFEKMSF